MHAARSAGMAGHNPIAVSEILAFLELKGIAYLPERSKYLHLMQQLDSTYFNYLAETRPATKP